jgi:hypothetical protein
MSYGPPTTDEELEALQALGDRRWRLARLLHYPCYWVLALAQIARSRWTDFLDR